MRPLEPLLPGETRSEYLARVDSPRKEIEIVGWKILQALHEGVEDGPKSWSDMASDQEKRIRKAAVAAIEAVTDLSQCKAQGFSLPDQSDREKMEAWERLQATYNDLLALQDHSAQGE
jgi:RNA polymerase-interacting CarD/CdnL/TRCF family regulator